MRPDDTSPEAWKVFLDLQTGYSPSQRLQRALDWLEIVRETAAGGLRRLHPQASGHELFLRYARRRLGSELFRKVYGDVLPDDEPTRRSA